MERFAQRILPSWAYHRLLGQWNREGLKKYAANTWWVFIGRVALYPVSLITVASVARHLGPDGTGKLSYAQSVIGIIATIAALGIDQVLIRDLVRYPEKEHQILGTALITRLVMATLGFIAVVALYFTTEKDMTLNWVIFFSACSMIVGPLAMAGNAFTARALSKYTTYVTILTGLSVACFKLLFVYIGAPVTYFAALFLFESVFTVALTLFLYRRVFGRTLQAWTFSSKILTSLLRDSWPLLISGTSVYLFNRIDQVMLMHLYSNPSEVGMYGAAVQFSDLWTFLPLILVGSVYPAIAGVYHRDQSEYRKRMRTLTIVSVAIAVLMGLVVVIFAPLIISIIFGPLFMSAGKILRLYTLYVPLAVLYAIMQSHLVTANRTKMMLAMGIVGAVINIVLNIYLIPQWGALGATLATIIASAAMILLPFIFNKNQRPEAIAT